MSLAVQLLFAGLLIAAAVVDARERRLPNRLALALALTALVRAFLAGAPRLAFTLAIALGMTAAVLRFELLWRRFRGSAGVGMGDIKLLFTLLLVSPVRGVAAYAGGLVLLAIGCLIAGKRSLPLIPFIAVVWFALGVCGL